MGLFSDETITQVTSTSYNLAGAPEDRPNYLKTALIGSVFSDTGYIGPQITQSYLHGPGIQFKNFINWVDQGSPSYTDIIGDSVGLIGSRHNVNLNTLKDNLPNPSNENITIQSYIFTGANYGYWVREYLRNNNPNKLDDNYTAELDITPMGEYLITITFSDSTTTSFTPQNYTNNAKSLYVLYALGGGTRIDPIETGTLQTGPFPSTTDWTLEYDNTTTEMVDLDTVVEEDITYSDDTPPEHTSNTTTTQENYSKVDKKYSKVTSINPPASGYDIQNLYEYLYLFQNGSITQEVTTDTVEEDIGGGVTKTTVTTTTTDVLVLTKTYRIDTQDIFYENIGETKSFLYVKGTGIPALDAFFVAPTGSAKFAPPVPIRMNGDFVTDSWDQNSINLFKNATRKAISTNYEKLEDKIKESPNIDDMDYIYVLFGVDLNAIKNIQRNYIYNFFHTLVQDSTYSNDEYQDWLDYEEFRRQKVQDYNDWLDSNPHPNPNGGWNGSPPPEIPPERPAPLSTFTVEYEHLNLDLTIQWGQHTEVVKPGLYEPGAKVGDTKIIDHGEKFYEIVINNGPDNRPTTITRQADATDITIKYQISDTNYIELFLSDVAHINEIYAGKSVQITAHKALTAENSSEFIIPFSLNLLQNQELVDYTQLVVESAFVLINAYEQKTVPWYASSFFKFVLIVAIVVITVVTGGAGAGSAGLLGTNIAVGTALGLTGVAALVAGAAANAIAAMVLTKLIQWGVSELIGGKVGRIIGTIIAMVSLNLAASWARTGSFFSNVNTLFTAQNLIKLSKSVAVGFQEYLKFTAQETLAEARELQESTLEKLEYVQQSYKELVEVGNTDIDIGILRLREPMINESSDQFLSRTLLVGSDIAEITNAYISDFSKMTLQTDLPEM